MTPRLRPSVSKYLGVAILALLAVSPLGFMQLFQMILVYQLMIALALALSYDLMGGFMGYVNLGHIVYFGLAIFVFGILFNLGLNVFVAASLALIAVVAFAACISFPMYRLKGFYFAVAMLGLVFLFYYIMISDYITPWLTPTHQLSFGYVVISSGYPVRESYYLALALVTITILISAKISRSKFGLALKSIKEDEETAEVIGISTFRYKLLTMMLSASIAGAAGILYLWEGNQATASTVFSVVNAFGPVTMAMLGGTGTIIGPIIGGVIFYFVQQGVFFPIPAGYVGAVTGAILVFVGLAAPGGIIGIGRTVLSRRTGVLERRSIRRAAIASQT